MQLVHNIIRKELPEMCREKQRALYARVARKTIRSKQPFHWAVRWRSPQLRPEAQFAWSWNATATGSPEWNGEQLDSMWQGNSQAACPQATERMGVLLSAQHRKIRNEEWKQAGLTSWGLQSNDRDRRRTGAGEEGVDRTAKESKKSSNYIISYNVIIILKH